MICHHHDRVVSTWGILIYGEEEAQAHGAWEGGVGEGSLKTTPIVISME